MSKIGLSQKELEDILAEGIQNGQIASAEKTRTAIAEAIVANNEAIRKEISNVVSEDLLKEMKKQGM